MAPPSKNALRQRLARKNNPGLSWKYNKKWRDKNREKWNAYQRAYFKTDQSKTWRSEYRLRPEVLLKNKARFAVFIAVQKGKIVKPKLCSQCLKKKALEGHHHKGYSKVNWLNVVWLCIPCHKSHEE